MFEAVSEVVLSPCLDLFRAEVEGAVTGKGSTVPPDVAEGFDRHGN